MNEKTESLVTGLIDMVRDFKGADFVEPAAGATNLKLTDDLGLDSLDIINLLFQIDENYGVKVAASDIMEHDLLVVENLASYIAERQ